MASVYLNFKHGTQVQTIELEAGSNILLTPSADGKKISIGVTPDDNWGGSTVVTKQKAGLCPQLGEDQTDGTKTFLDNQGQWSNPMTNLQLATKQKAGLCPQLGAIEGTYLNSNGIWSTPPSASPISKNNAGVVPAYPSGGTFLFTEGGWKKYRVQQVPILIIRNPHNLTQGGSTFHKTVSRTDFYSNSGIYHSYGKNTSGQQSENLGYAVYDSHLTASNDGTKSAAIYVNELWFKSLDIDYFVIGITHCKEGKYGLYLEDGVKEVKNSSGSVISTQRIDMRRALVYACPNPYIDAWAGHKNASWQASGKMCGWSKAEKDDPKIQYNYWVDSINDDWNWLSWVTEGNKAHTVFFTTPMLVLSES